ncbi:cob(I)yrinic acid a,c-diamide adenosyltransferase [Miltoncostaea marina]|uniref:cob(I)yrinic acid a,c-diamide adenosyltransferase n=1 Tax=Miltoncostaea marina TaxID=2843215 RepID=UPI001C3D3FBE|nr:cob(I)yrinic acid a,c-diamide adenosyltransferase [Miltoncostaea marina]
MVRLTRIYTRLGDEGDTHLGDMSRARKTSPRVVAYGEVDELNAAIGVARAHGVDGRIDAWLAVVQNDLFDLGADLCVPPGGDAERSRLRVEPAQVERLEAWCEELNATLPDLTSFVLPAGSPAAAALHLARTICRRAERSCVALADAEPVTPAALAYLNRLSDLLFILARAANRGAGGDVLWVPGEHRSTGAGPGAGERG